MLDYNEYEIKVSCSKGTYIRSLIDDIGTALGTHAVMTYLRRTASNGFSIDEAVPLDALSEMPFDAAAKTLISIDAAMSSYPEITVTEAQAKRFLNGGALSIGRLKNIKTDGLFRGYSPDRRFLGLGEAGAELLNPKRVINADE